jgi:hypothetical protein
MKKLLVIIAAALAFSLVPPSAFSAAEPAGFEDPQDRTRTLSGHVFDCHDQALQKAVVYLKNTKSLAVKTYITDPDGGYEVCAECNGARGDTKTLSAFDNRKRVNITLRVK